MPSQQSSADSFDADYIPRTSDPVLASRDEVDAEVWAETRSPKQSPRARVPDFGSASIYLDAAAIYSCEVQSSADMVIVAGQNGTSKLGMDYRLRNDDSSNSSNIIDNSMRNTGIVQTTNLESANKSNEFTCAPSKVGTTEKAEAKAGAEAWGGTDGNTGYRAVESPVSQKGETFEVWINPLRSMKSDSSPLAKQTLAAGPGGTSDSCGSLSPFMKMSSLSPAISPLSSPITSTSKSLSPEPASVDMSEGDEAAQARREGDDRSGTESSLSQEAQRSVLSLLYSRGGGHAWRRNENWASDNPMWMWHGVSTDTEGDVSGIVLIENNVTGTCLDSSLAWFFRAYFLIFQPFCLLFKCSMF